MAFPAPTQGSPHVNSCASHELQLQAVAAKLHRGAVHSIGFLIFFHTFSVLANWSVQDRVLDYFGGGARESLLSADHGLSGGGVFMFLFPYWGTCWSSAYGQCECGRVHVSAVWYPLSGALSLSPEFETRPAP